MCFEVRCFFSCQSLLLGTRVPNNTVIMYLYYISHIEYCTVTENPILLNITLKVFLLKVTMVIRLLNVNLPFGGWLTFEGSKLRRFDNKPSVSWELSMAYI